MITQTQIQAQTQQAGTRRYSPLKYQRLLRGWSQQDVADEVYKLCVASGRPDVGLSAARVGEWENGRHKPSPIYRKHLCQLYGLTADKLGFIENQEVQA
jgi:transcriptional regulator with XRE-family HTH domain